MTNKELDRCLEHMHYAFRNLIREPDRILAKYGLGRAHHRALYCIGHYAPSIGQAAKALQVSNQAFHRTMCNLITSNLVRVQTDKRNRRSRRLLLTAKGRRLEQRINGIQRHMFARVARIVGRKRMATWSVVMDQLAALRVGEGGASG